MICLQVLQVRGHKTRDGTPPTSICRAQKELCAEQDNNVSSQVYGALVLFEEMEVAVPNAPDGIGAEMIESAVEGVDAANDDVDRMVVVMESIAKE